MSYVPTPHDAAIVLIAFFLISLAAAAVCRSSRLGDDMFERAKYDQYGEPLADEE